MVDLSGNVLLETQWWLQRARVNSKAAMALVDKGDVELLVEAVSQVQQACEKATKAVMIAQGMPYCQVKGMGHNTIGAFVNLIAEMLGTIPQAEDVSKALLTSDATVSANILTKVVLTRQHKRHRKKVLYAWKQVLPESSGNLGNKALDAGQWKRLTRAFPPQVVEIFVDFHEYLKDIWRRYCNEISNTFVDPRPLLSKSVPVEIWVYSPDHAGLPRRSPGQETDAPINSILAKVAEQLLEEFLERMLRQHDERYWPDKINIREVVLHIGRWLSSLGWLFLCATVTTPHATSSRYPARVGSTSDEIGSQHYTKSLGVVACIGPLATHTDEAIRNLVRHYRDIDSGFQQWIR